MANTFNARDGARRRQVLAAAGSLLATGWAGMARAAPPRQNLNIVVGFPAGGPADSAARLMAEALRGLYANTVIVDNRPGAGGRIAVEYTRNAESEGGTVLLVPGTMMTLTPHLYPQLSYAPRRDFTPVAPAFSADLALIVGPSVPESVKTLADFVRWGKANPKELFFGVGAQGSLTHFLGLMFAKAAGVEFTYVPYKGGPDVMRDLLGGRVATTFTVLSETVSSAKAGKLRILGVSGARRSALTPEVPTLKEGGVNVEASGWFGFYASSKMSAANVQVLADAIAAAQKNPAVVRGFTDIGYTITPMAQPAFAAMAQTDFERWGPIVKDSGVKLD